MAKRKRGQELAADHVESEPKKALLSKAEIMDAFTQVAGRHEEKVVKAGKPAIARVEDGNGSEDGEDDDEEDGDDDDDDDDYDQEEKLPKKRATLSAQDVQIARETAELFKSNIFKLQIDELIKEVKLKDTKVSKIEKFLHKLHDFIQKVPDLKDQTLEQVEKWFQDKKVVVPFNDPKPTNVNYRFGYVQPENVSIVGSFGLKTAIQTNRGLSVDVNVTMPRELFQAKDYLNYRALHKRSFYLGFLAEHLRETFLKEGLDFLKLTYKYLNDDILAPVLRIQASDKNLDSEYNFHTTKFTINILIGFPFGLFDSRKLLPNKNCIRVQKDEELDLPPTQLYNASILTMTSYDHYLKYLYTTKKTADQFKESCILGRLWLQQRGMNSNMENGGFGHFEFAVLASALLNGGGVNGSKVLLHGFSSYQLFKGVVKYLATENLCTDGHLQFYSNSTEPTRYIKNGFNIPTLFDKTTKINILYKVTKNSYQILVQHARRTLQLLNDVVRDRFDVLFLKNSDVDYLKYDLELHFELAINEDSSFGPFEKITFLTYDNYIANKISKALSYGLGDRVHGFNITFNRNVEFEISKRKSSNHNRLGINVGILVNASEAEKLVTKGPTDAEDSTKFRSFWGPKSSLRRFKDGVVQHSVIWSTDYKEPIVVSMAKYILQNHIQDNLQVQTIAPHFNQLLPIPNLPSSLKQSVISTNAFSSLLKSYDNLYKVLIKLELPLAIKSILPISTALRYTSFLQPVPFAISNKDFFNELILQFETSTRWPDEILALERVKTAFLLKISEILSKETSFISYLSKDEDSIPYNFEITTLNILSPDGYGFKIRVLTERDEILYLRAIENCPKEKKAVLESIYLKFNEKYMGSIVHTRTIASLSHHFPFYSPTVRLFKKWLDDQLLLNHFSEELVELIALKPFVDPEQYDVPSSVENGFLKILTFLSTWNWKEDPLILDLSPKADYESSSDSDILSKLSDRLTVQSYQQIKSNFEQIRKDDPNGSKIQFFVASKADKSGILWSNSISLPIATRLTALSKVAVQLIKKNGLNSNTIDLLFTPSSSDYDFSIRLKTLPLTTSSGVLPTTSATFKNLLNNSSSYPADITSHFNPILKLVKELSSKFQNTIILSYHNYTINEKGENMITGLFVPNVLQKSKFKVQIGYNIKPLSQDQVIINKESILNEILNLSGDLVAGFESK